SLAEDVLKRIGSYTAVLPEGSWIVGSGLSETFSAEDTARIDKATPDHPLFIYLEGAKKALVNSVAADGNARVVEGAELAKFRRVVPKDHSTNYAKLAETASNYAASLGITSIQEM